jgi:hypothetical protein
MDRAMTAEEQRLEETRNRSYNWRRWGPYLSERAWGTIREDYSPNGAAWEYFPHDHARSRVYRWNEDGIAGISDRHQSICFALALWNEQDPILKERLFGLTGNEGNHGEDVKYALKEHRSCCSLRMRPTPGDSSMSTTRSPFVKDGINDDIVLSAKDAVNPAQSGTKACGHYDAVVKAGESIVVRLRLTDGILVDQSDGIGHDFAAVLAARQQEANEFYATVIPDGLSEDASNVMRQALGGMLWSKQFYHYVVRDWLNGDPGQPPPPEERRHGRNWQWPHVHNSDVLSMPDKWEYPWYAAWDLVLFYEHFHGDNGRGVGASHQTGWTGLVAKLLQQSGAR